jgi:hypothetical protein
VPYPEIRDRFLAASERTNRVAWLIEVGRFVEDRWLAEEEARPAGEPLDEEASWDLWDSCTEKYLRDLRTEARTLLKQELHRGRLAALAKKWWTNVEPLQAFFRALRWVLAQIGKTIVGAIGLLAFTLFVLWLFPGLVQTARSTLDRLLPQDISTEAGGAAGGKRVAVRAEARR